MTSDDILIPNLDEKYGSLLAQAATLPREQLLVRSYALGRDVLKQGLSIGQVLSAHQSATVRFVEGARDPVEAAKIAHNILGEVLSPFETVLRGVENANEALRNINELLEKEARRIAHSLHDEAGQLIATLSLAVQCLGCGHQTACGTSVEHVQGLVGQAETMFRRLAHEMRPRVLDEMGLVPAIEFLAQGFSLRRGLQVEVHNELTERLCPILESSIYRMVQVALPNVVKHAGARNATIRLSKEDTWIKCSVIDDGHSTEPFKLNEANSDGLGLMGIEERVKAIGGELRIKSVLPHGTEVSLYLPPIG
jgi:signal transduction histidine kinase